jgi:hypothetical protein
METHFCKKIDNVSLFDGTCVSSYLESLNKSTSRPQVDSNNYRAKSPSLIFIAFRTTKALKMQPRRALKNCADAAVQSLSQGRNVSQAATLVLKAAEE